MWRKSPNGFGLFIRVFCIKLCVSFLAICAFCPSFSNRAKGKLCLVTELVVCAALRPAQSKPLALWTRQLADSFPVWEERSPQPQAIRWKKLFCSAESFGAGATLQQRCIVTWHLASPWLRGQMICTQLCIILIFKLPREQFRSRLETELLARSYQQSYWIYLCVTVTLWLNFFRSVKSLDLHHVTDDSNTN